MEANELRIGNYVEYAGETIKILGITEEHPFINMITIDYLYYDEIFPIPLTEEWLIKFGFIKDPRVTMESYEIVNNQHCYRVEKFLSVIKPKNTYDFRLQYTSNESYFLNSLQYVHQLQNLYFALTNKELN